jgi:hypothetical protein
VLQVVADLAQRPVGRGHGDDAELLVQGGPPGVVDPGDDPRDPVDIPCHPCGDDVGVVPAGHGDHGVGPGDAGPLEHVAVEADALDGLAGELLAQPLERFGVLVDHGDHLPGRRQPGREPGSNPATANDHHAHAGQASAGAVSGSGITNR